MKFEPTRGMAAIVVVVVVGLAAAAYYGTSLGTANPTTVTKTVTVTSSSRNFVQIMSVEAILVRVTPANVHQFTTANWTGDYMLYFAVTWKNTGSSVIYYQKYCGSNSLNSTILPTSEPKIVVLPGLGCQGPGSPSPLKPGENTTSGDPGPSTRRVFSLTGGGRVDVRFTLTWYEDRGATFSNAMTIEGSFGV